jgi:D-3-phosphoglycerate dehydrogenase / 2-oxoglutarate reductase
MPKFKVLLTDYAWPNLDIERRTLAEVDAELVVAERTDPASLAAAAVDADAIMTNWVNVPAEVIDAAPKCRIVARLGIGLDNIDVAAASRRGMLVTNIPDYCLTEVAEHALALLLSLARKVAFYHHQTKSGRYDLKAGPPLRRIEGQTLGIVGMGHIGQALAAKALALGLKVLAADPVQQAAPQGVTFCDLDELLTRSDYVSLHVPLVPQTRHLIGRQQLARMKPSAFLINTARGGLLDASALAEALAADKLAGAGLDVQEPEPPDLSQPPWNDPRVIVTPHAAFASEESLADLRRRTAVQVADCLSGRSVAHVVNQAALKGASRGR